MASAANRARGVSEELEKREESKIGVESEHGQVSFYSCGSGRGLRSRSSMTMALRWVLGTGDDAGV
jgi:hypothetical protein